MKPIIASMALAAAAASLAAPARADDLRWEGTLFITAITPACAPSGGGATALVGDQWTWVFRDLDGAQTMSIIGQRRALAFAPKGSDAFKKAGGYAGTYIGSDAVGSQNGSDYSGFKTSPAKISQDVRTLTLSGKISDFGGTAGCDPTFEAAGVRRPGF